MLPREINKIRELLPTLSYNSFILIDLDETVIKPEGGITILNPDGKKTVIQPSSLGSDHWFAQFLKLCSEGVDPVTFAKIRQLIVDLNVEVQQHIKMKPVDDVIAKIIFLLQEVHIPVLAVTARTSALAERTTNQLEAINIDFSKNWSIGEFCLGKGKTGQIPLYSKGIIYCGGNHKGALIKHFCSALEIHLEHAAIIDDNKNNVIDMSEALKPVCKKITGLHYANPELDQRIKQFDLELSQTELIMLAKVSTSVCHVLENILTTIVTSVGSEKIKHSPIFSFYRPNATPACGSFTEKSHQESTRIQVGT